MSRPNVWATKVAALIQGGNSAAALEQIKVAPSVKDLEQLQALLSAAKALTHYQNIEQTIAEQIVTLSSSPPATLSLSQQAGCVQVRAPATARACRRAAP